MTVEIYSGTFDLGGTEISIELTADHRGLTACRLLPLSSAATIPARNEYLAEAAASLVKYLSGQSKDLPTRIAPDGTLFQQRVWQVTRDIPYGEVRSYSWVAKRAGNPKAVRAVAQALAANPLLLFVPCHRVVRNNGSLGGFACGVEWKERLLAHEGVADTSKSKLALT